MARGRMISKTLGTSSRKFARVRTEHPTIGLFAQALYPLLVASSDDFGRQQADPFTVKHSVWPTAPENEDDFCAALLALHKVGLVQLYGAVDARYVQVVDFEAHQQGLQKRTRSKYPDPPEIPESLGNAVLTELNRTEWKRTEQNISVEPQEPSEVRGLLAFPTIGTGTNAWQLTETQVAEWATSFPGVDVLGQCRQALAWVLASPGRRKTSRGMAKFLVGWLGRAVDSGRARPTTAPKPPATFERAPWICPHDPHCSHQTACEIMKMRKVSA